MKQTEQTQLKAIVEELAEIQKIAPSVAIYKAGRTQASVSFRLLAIIQQLRGMIDEKELSNG